MTTFEIASLVVNSTLLLMTAGATVVAWTMAIAARRDKVAAEAAREATVRAGQESAAALVAANLIAQGSLDAQHLALPPPWGRPTLDTAPNSYSVRNESGRTLVVKAMAPLPGGNIYRFMPPDLPARVENGDTIRFVVVLAGPESASGNSFELRWSSEDQPDLDMHTVRHL